MTGRQPSVYSARPALVVAAAVILCGTGGSALAQTAGTLTVIANVKDPSGGVIRGSDGAMYGTSVTGPGTSNCGYVYRLARSGGTFGLQILHEFMGAPSGGCQPNGELVLGLDGALYGTTRYGGANTHGYIGQPVGTGTIYRVVTSGVHSVTVLHSFAGVDGSGLYVEGIWPVVGLAMGPDGTFYGVNAVGGTGSFSPGPGTLFRYSQAGGLDVLHNFFVSPATDQDPNDALTFGSDGSLYWTDTLNSALRRLTPGSGPSSPSTVFTFPNTGCSNSAACDPLGKNPYARPTEVSGQLYVLSKDFGAPPGGYGALVRVDQNGAGHLVHGFSGGPDGGHPQVALTRGSDGFLYGVTGGANQTGPTIFRVAPDGTGFQTLHEFVLSGPGPRAPLFEFAPGELIGTSGSAGGYIFHLSLLPALSSLSPWSATVGGAGFALTVNGTRFVSGSQVRWNGSPRPTTFINGGQLQATISASDLATGGTASVTVTNPGPITGPSNALPFVIAPTMALDKTTLHFGAVKSGASLLSQTSAQIVRLTQSGAGTVTWTASSNQPWLQVTPASGSGSANLSISVSAAGTPASGSVSGSISLVFTGAGNTPGPINVTLKLFVNGTSAPPIVNLDTPLDNSANVTGAVPFTGWATDDIEVLSVAICRAPFGSEVAPIDPNCGGQAQIFIGFAVFIEGARPDVAAAYPTYPASSKAGWGLMVLTNMLPAQGNGTYVFSMWAKDRDGHTVLMGTRTMTCANASAVNPFGTIDTPLQGDVVSGAAFINYGWALTPLTKTIPTDGSTIQVVVDGGVVGSPVYNQFRQDIATLFPGLNNTNGAVGFRALDTTALTNGSHTIAWVVTDNQGAAEGLGSRYFTVSNGASSLTAAPVTSFAAGGSHDLPLQRRSTTPLRGRRGWQLDAPLQTFTAEVSGRFVVRSEEVSRIELQLEPGTRGAVRTPEGLAALPIGSQLNAETGVFTWAPGVGYVGTYDLVFSEASGAVRDVRVVLQPKGSGAVGPQVVIDRPRMQQDVGQPFELAGWAADLGASQGTGIATLHAWAYPLTGGPPVFLGAPSYGGLRPDVAAVHGASFEASGFSLSVQGLTPGHYDVAVFAWSFESMAFAPATTVRITVR